MHGILIPKVTSPRQRCHSSAAQRQRQRGRRAVAAAAAARRPAGTPKARAPPRAHPPTHHGSRPIPRPTTGAGGRQPWRKDLPPIKSPQLIFRTWSKMSSHQIAEHPAKLKKMLQTTIPQRAVGHA
eukprot:gene18220-biopygen9931